MSYLLIIGLVLFVVIAFAGPLIWDLMRENNQLQVQSDQAEYFRIACENSSDGLVIQDMQARILWANPAYARIHGMSPEDIIGRSPLEYALPADQTPSAKEIQQFRYDSADPAWSGLELVKNVHADGTEFWNQINVSFRTTEDGRQNAILVCRDVTEGVRQQNELRDVSKRLEFEATHDTLTGVPNRAAFLSFIDDALNKTGRDPVGLLHIDLDNFKTMNDTHGHSAGDAVLTNTAEIIQKNLRSCDLLARVGGDEFVVVCPQTPDLAYLDQLGTHLIQSISEPFEWFNHILQIQASIGAALTPSKPITGDELLIHADFALYEAKRAGRNTVALYDENLHNRFTAQTRRAAEIVDAIDTGVMSHYFQPIMALDTGQIIRMETLVRWDHPKDGIIAPDDFLPLVKELGLIATLDLLSMTAALAQKREMNLAGFDHIGIAFNASPELLSHPDFIRRLVWGVEAAGISRAHVTIEVLETTNFGDAAQTNSHAATIADLRHAGFQVHLDDFGVGFAGLSHLATLDVTGVKIDRGLVTDLLTDPISYKIARKIVELCNDLALNVTAEGVEDVETADALQTMGCNVIQGYWLARPMPTCDINAWLTARSTLRAAKRA